MSKNKFAAFNFLLYLCARFRRLAMGDCYGLLAETNEKKIK